jgi:hypothetical protein
MRQTGKRGYNPKVGLCSVIIPAKGIRRDIEIVADPKLRKLVEFFKANTSIAGNDFQRFGAMQAALATMVEETPHNLRGIGAVALAIHEHTGNAFFVVEAYHRSGGLGTDFVSLVANTDEEALAQVEKRHSAQTVRMMAMLNAARELHD